MPDPLTRIGQGFCGTVWAADGHTFQHKGIDLAIKREDGGPGRSLWNEWEVQQLINAKSAEYDTLLQEVRIPRAISFWEPCEGAWSSTLGRFPAGYEACNAMLSERIHPVVQAGRSRLITDFCPRGILPHVLDDEKNQACLVRCYLGRRRLADRPKRFFSLRNFPLHIDQMEILALPIPQYATAIAKALAFLHWACKIDGNDIEFVLAAMRADESEAATGTAASALGPHGVWVLDFDCCRRIELGEGGVERIVRAFWRNDPYFPRPGAEKESDQHLWEHFAAEYFRSSVAIIASKYDATEATRLTQLVSLVLTRITESGERRTEHIL